MPESYVASTGLDSKALVPYDFEGSPVRITDREGNLWFIASDVARELGYRMASDLTRYLDGDEKGTLSERTPSGTQEMSIISEPGLYRAITQRRASRKTAPEILERIARFQHWVFHDVLPQIRKTGGYGKLEFDPDDDEQMADVTLKLLEKVRKLKEQNAILKPKALCYDDAISAEGTFERDETAMMLEVSRKDLTSKMVELRWMKKTEGDDHYKPYQPALDAGFIIYKPVTVTLPGGRKIAHGQITVTTRGFGQLAMVFHGENPEKLQTLFSRYGLDRKLISARRN